MSSVVVVPSRPATAESPLRSARLPSQDVVSPVEFAEPLPLQVRAHPDGLLLDSRLLPRESTRAVVTDLGRIVSTFITDRTQGADYSLVLSAAREVRPDYFTRNDELLAAFSGLPLDRMHASLSFWKEALAERDPYIPFDGDLQALRDTLWHGRTACDFALQLEYGTAIALGARSPLRFSMDSLLAKLKPTHHASPLHFNPLRFISTSLEETREQCEILAQTIRLCRSGTAEHFDRAVAERELIASPTFQALGMAVHADGEMLLSSLFSGRSKSSLRRVNEQAMNLGLLREISGFARDSAQALTQLKDEGINLSSLLYNVSFIAYRQFGNRESKLAPKTLLWSSNLEELPLGRAASRALSIEEQRELGTALLDGAQVTRAAAAVGNALFPTDDSRERIWGKAFKTSSPRVIPLLTRCAQRFEKLWEQDLDHLADLLERSAAEVGVFHDDARHDERLAPLSIFKFARNTVARIARAEAEAELRKRA